MPNINQAGTYTQDNPGFEFLGPTRNSPVLLFAGNSAAVSIQYLDDTDNWQEFEGGNISSLPKSIEIAGIKRPIQLVVTGSPDFNVTGA